MPRTASNKLLSRTTASPRRRLATTHSRKQHIATLRGQMTLSRTAFITRSSRILCGCAGQHSVESRLIVSGCKFSPCPFDACRRAGWMRRGEHVVSPRAGQSAGTIMRCRCSSLSQIGGGSGQEVCHCACSSTEDRADRTLRAILRNAGIRVEEFWKSL